MTDWVADARTARQQLAQGLGVLQTPGLPDHLTSAAEPIAQAMSQLHRIESTGGAALPESAPVALLALRRALGLLQSGAVPHPACDQAIEYVARSLGQVHGLAQQAEHAGAAARPAPAAALAGTVLSEQAQPAPPRAQFPQQPPAVQYPPPEQAPQWPQPQAQYHAQPGPQYAQPGPQYAQPGPQYAQPGPQYAQQAPPTLGSQYAPGQPVTGAQYAQPQQQPPGPPQYAQPQQGAPPAPYPMQPYPAQPAQAEARAPQFAAAAQPVPQAAPAQEPRQGGRPPLRVEAELGAHSATNFYKGLSGNDIIDSGGIFVATYQIPPVGSDVVVKVSLPGGYEFEALGVVAWTRDAPNSGTDAPPGFGARFTQISPEGRQLVYRYVRNREPLFHDDL